jgi:DNA-binding helix-hairpin-helix protein with protein kinase domain
MMIEVSAYYSSKIMQVFDEDGSAVTLDRSLYEGGEGRIFAHPDDPSLLIKIYKSPSASRAEKLSVLVGIHAGASNNIYTFPTRLLFDRETAPRIVAGFIMPKAIGESIHRLLGARDRIARFPRWSWRHLVRLATNCAASFAHLHSQNIVLGDVSENNLLVNHDGTVSTIDCDSFQVTDSSTGKIFPCEVGVIAWTAPELHGADLRTAIRTENHDNFSLAILIFKILFFGRHPFASARERDATIEEAITQFHFGYSPMVGHLNLAPPPQSLRFSAIGQELMTMFESAFLAGSSYGSFHVRCLSCDQPITGFRNEKEVVQCPNCHLAYDGWDLHRPTAAEWYAALSRFDAQLECCKTNPLHYHLPEADCPLCELDETGFAPFLTNDTNGISVASASLAISPEMERLFDAILATNGVEFEMPVPSHPSQIVATPLRPGLKKYRILWPIGFISLVVAVLLQLLGIFHWPATLITSLLAVVILIQGRFDRSYIQEREQRYSRHKKAEQEFKSKQIELQNVATHGRIIEFKTAARKALHELNRLPERYQLELKNFNLKPDQKVSGGKIAMDRVQDIYDYFVLEKAGLEQKMSSHFAAIQTLNEESRVKAHVLLSNEIPVLEQERAQAAADWQLVK